MKKQEKDTIKKFLKRVDWKKLKETELMLKYIKEFSYGAGDGLVLEYIRSRAILYPTLHNMMKKAAKRWNKNGRPKNLMRNCGEYDWFGKKEKRGKRSD